MRKPLLVDRSGERQEDRAHRDLGEGEIASAGRTLSQALETPVASNIVEGAHDARCCRRGC
jgi:hypothetical protein